LPTVGELVVAPELAILAALDDVIDLAIIALVAAQPELQPAADQRDDAESSVAVAADHLIAAAQALAAAVATYRVALRDRRDDELPF
jgi:hypothetical protein